MKSIVHILALGVAFLSGSVSASDESCNYKAADIRVTAGAFAPPSSPWDESWQVFKRNLESRSNCRAAAKLLIRAETGGEPVTMSAVRRGRIQAGGFTIGGSSAIVPELSLLLTPYFFDNVQELDKVMDEHLLDIFRPLFAEKNLYLVNWVEVGWMNFYANHPVILPEHLKAKRIRSQASEANQVLITSLGADIMQMPFTDVVPSLQTGLIEGGESNSIFFGVTGLAKEAKNFTLTRHSYETGVMVVNRDWIMGLSEADRNMVLSSFQTSEEARVGLRSLTDTVLESIYNNGVTNVHTLSPDQREAWKQATADNAQLIIERVGGKAADVYKAMVRARAQVRAELARAEGD